MLADVTSEYVERPGPVTPTDFSERLLSFSTDEIRPFHSNFDCFRFESQPAHSSLIER
jgi:hypothetical protein